VIHVGDTGAYRVEGFEWAHERAGRKNLDLDAAASGDADHLRQPNRASVKARRTVGPVGYHLQLSDALCDRRRREIQGRAGGQ
jgi:hypothetical protein